MPRLHCYVPLDLAEELRRRAENEGLSVSAYLAALIRRGVRRIDWPAGFFETVVGGWQGEAAEREPQPPVEQRDGLR